MKYLVILLSIVIFIGCESSTDPEQPDHKMYLSSENTNISVSEQSQVTLKILNMPKAVFGMSLQLAYNNTVLSFSDTQGLSVGDYFGDNTVVFVNEDNSRIYLTLSKIQGESSASGSGDICTLTFTGLSAGSSIIQFSQSDIHFYNSAGETITMSDLKYEGTSITVQ